MRIKGLDFLRGIAIVGVLFRHSHLQAELPLFYRAGWAGVDLFFVLSGFLVSRLLFLEYQKQSHIAAGRFLIRRGLKIYPTFYLFLLISIPVRMWMYGEEIPFRSILHEIFFLQSYLPHVWGHTWSLAVEEHFYLALILFVWLAWKIRLLSFRWLSLATLLGFWGLAFYYRFELVYAFREFEMILFVKSHLRMEGLIVGVVLSYLYHFFGGFGDGIRRYRIAVCGVACLMVLPPFLVEGGGYLISAYGLTIMHVGYALWVALAASTGLFERPLRWSLIRPAYQAIAYIGIHSYAIYVWHLFSRHVFDRSGLSHLPMELAYLAGSLLLGILLSRWIEQPVLQLRDRLFPRKVAVV